VRCYGNNLVGPGTHVKTQSACPGLAPGRTAEFPSMTGGKRQTTRRGVQHYYFGIRGGASGKMNCKELRRPGRTITRKIRYTEEVCRPPIHQCPMPKQMYVEKVRSYATEGEKGPRSANPTQAKSPIAAAAPTQISGHAAAGQGEYANERKEQREVRICGWRQRKARAGQV